MDFTKLKENLEKNNFEVSEFNTAEEAVKYLAETINGKSIGFGGSISLQKMGLFEALADHNEMHWAWQPAEGLTNAQEQRNCMGTDIYFSSVNGIAETGEIINIDGTGNRVAGTLYGHEKIYLVVGENKIAPDYEKALDRARNIASPLNAQRLNKKTPCAVKGDRCYDCSSPDRICNALSVFWKKPGSGAYEVVLIHENLGY